MDNIVNTMDTRKRRKEGSSRTPSLESLQASPKRARVHAQRKFAQGSQPNSPAPTPVKETRELRDRSNSNDTRNRIVAQPQSTPPLLDIVEVPMRPTVEDFLTFLCYRGTPLLPPELEHFNTPQLLETASDSRSQSPSRDDKVKSSTKKKQEGLMFEKKDRELSKEAVKKNLEHSTDIEDYEATPTVRVTRSTTQPPPVSSANAVEQHHSPQKVSKRLMIKKALILRSKVKSLRIQERREVSLRKLDKHLGDSSHAQGSVIATRSGRLLHKYRVSATTAMARKKSRVAKLSSMRPKQKLSRILQRLGGTSTHSDTKLHRITRSQVEARDSSSEKLSEETQTVGTEKTDIVVEGSKESRKEKENPKVTRSLRLLRQRPDGKKVYVKKVVKVNNKGKSAKELNSSSKSLSLSQPSLNEESVPMARRLRKKSSTVSASGLESSETTALLISQNSCPSTSNSSMEMDLELKADSKDLEDSEKLITKSSYQKKNDVNGNQKKAERPCGIIPENSYVNDTAKSPNSETCSELQECQKPSETISTVNEKDLEKSVVVDVVSEPKKQCNAIEFKSSEVLEKKKSDEEVLLPVDQKETEILLKPGSSPLPVITTNIAEVSDVSFSDDRLSETVGSVESTKDSIPSALMNEQVQKESAKKGSLNDSNQEELHPERMPSDEKKSSLQKENEKQTTQSELSCVSDEKPNVTSEESVQASVEMTLDQEKSSTDSDKSEDSNTVECFAEKKLAMQETPCSLRSTTLLEGHTEEMVSENNKDEHVNRETAEIGDSLKQPESEPSSDNLQTAVISVVDNSPVVQPENVVLGDSEKNTLLESPVVTLESSEVCDLQSSDSSKQATCPRSPPNKHCISEAASCPNTNKKAFGMRETRKNKENVGIPNQINSTTAAEETSDTGVRTRPSRRTKEAATVYLELIGRKLAKEPKTKASVQGDSCGDNGDDDEDDAVSISSIMDLKDLAKTKGRDSEKERRDKVSMWKMDTGEALSENFETEDLNASTACVRYSTRKSPRQKRDVTDQVTDEDRASIGKRRLSKDESNNTIDGDKQSSTKVKRKLEQEEISSPEKAESKLTKEPSAASLGHHGGQKPSVVTRAGSRNLRRTRSDAEEPRRKGSRPSSRRFSLELDSLSSFVKQKQVSKGKQGILGEKNERELADDIILIDSADQLTNSENFKVRSGSLPPLVTQLEGKCDAVSNSLSEDKEIVEEDMKDEKEMFSDKIESELNILNEKDDETKEKTNLKGTGIENKEKPSFKGTGIETKEKLILKKSDIEIKEKPILMKKDTETKEKLSVKKIDVEIKEKPILKKADVAISDKCISKKVDREVEGKLNIAESENDIIFISESKDRIAKSSSVSAAAPEIIHEVINKAPVITGKTHRTVLQDRKSRKNVAKDEGKYMCRRKSLENSAENVLGHSSSKSSMRGKTSSCGSGDDCSNENEERKTLRAFGRQKVVGSRRRSSNHDEAKLNEVLESVAKDFEREIDEDHYDQIEKDFVLGNKSPDKGISDKMIELSEKEDSNLTEFINFCMDDKISCNLEAFGSSGNERTPSGNSTPQPGSSSPSLNKRSVSSKKLSDVVRSLQKKQAESPSTTSGPTENPTFLKDLNTWSSDKLRQVSPQSGSFHLESLSTSSAPKVVSPNDASMPEIVHIPCAPTATTTPPSPEIITSKAPSPLPDRSFSQKVAITKTPSVGSPTNSPVTSHSSSSVVTMTTSCLQANAPYTAVTFSASYNVVHTSTAPLGTPAPACDIQTVNAVPKSVPLKSFQTSKDEEVTVLSSIPVAVNPSTSVNVLNSGFSPSTVPGLPKITSSVTLSSHVPCVLNCAKSVELSAHKSSPKQLHIAPKPSRSAAPLTSTLTNPLPLPVLPQGAIKQVPKPVQIAPKPPAATHVHHNTQMLTHQSTHLMQTQVQTPMQAIPQQLQGVKAIPQTVQTIPTALSQPVPNMQALSQTIQTMQAIPQPVQSMHTIPQTVQTVPQPIQTVQTLAPPIQTVTAVPVQAVITQTVINPTHIVTPSSPARMINHPVFATSSNQSTVTYTLAPHPISQSQLQTNVGAVARVLAPAVVGKVATRPQSNLMTPKPPESVVALSPGTIANTGQVRPIAPLPQQVQVTQPQILAVNVVPVVSTAVVGQGGLIARPQGSVVVPSCHVSGNHPFVPPASTVNSETCASNPHTTLAFSQHVPLSNPSTSYVPSNTVVATYPLPSSGVTVNPPQNNVSNPQNVACETVPLSANPTPRALIVSNPTNIKPVCNSISVQNPHPMSCNVPTPTGITEFKTNTVMSNSSENNQSAVMDKRHNTATTTTAIVEAAFKGNIPSSVKIAETSKTVPKVIGPVSVANSKCHSRVPALMKSQIASSSITITTIGEISQGSGNSSNLKTAAPHTKISPSSDLNIKLPTGVSVVHHKTGVGRNIARTSLPSMQGASSSRSQACENDKGVSSVVSLSTEKNRRVISTQLKKDDVYNTFIATSCSKFDREKVSNSNVKNDTTLYQSNESQFKSNRDVSVTAAYSTCSDKSKMSHPPFAPSQEIRQVDKMLNSIDKPQNEFDKRTADKRREPLLKRTLFKTKSHEERRPTNMSPVYRTKSQDDKKPSGAFSPLHESSVYAFDEPDLETSAIEVSPFSQRIKNIQSSPGTSPVKTVNAVRPPNPIPVGTKPLGRVNIGPRCHVSRSLTPLMSAKPKPSVISNVNVTQPVSSVKKPPCSPKAVSTATDTAVCTSKLDVASEAGNEVNKMGEESQQVPENNECIKKNSNSTSIAIQCDMDESIVEESVRANESGTQTDGPSKFPIPPSASPFYYLPLAMAALGEKLPAQLVQQMLAKTQGIVGAAEAGLILQKAAQLAQQHQQNLAQQGTPGPCLGVSSAVKPIKPASVAPLISGISSSPCVTNVTPLKPPVSKYQETPCTSGESVIATTTISNAESKVAASSSSVNVSTSESVSVTSSVTPLSAPSQIPSTSFVTTVIPTCVSSTLTSTVPGTNTDLPSHIPPHRPQPTSTTIPSSDEVGSTTINKVEPEPKSRKRRGQSIDAIKNQSDDNPPTRRRSGRATTLAATRATESDMHEIEELRRNRRAKRAAAALAKEEGWSSSSEAPLSPQMSPDTLRGWPPPRLTSPTPSQSSEGTTSSTPSQRGNRLSASRSRRQSPANNIENKSYSSIGGISVSQLSNSSTSVTPDKNAEESITYVCDNSVLVRAPSFYPSEEEFSDPLDYIEKIRPEAEQFGVCRIVPPSSFKPECRVNDDMRFTSNNQYIHKMMKRWGPNVRTLHAIKRCLSRQNIELTSNPLIGCMELDLVRLYEVVEQHGGLMSVIEKDMWGKVADACRIPRSAQERLTKLDSIYCKYLLPYATLSQDERAQLLEEVDAMHSRNRGEQPGKRTSSVTSDAEDDEEEESLDCIVKGKSTALSTFYRVARNISTQWQPDPSGLEVDERYWSIVVNGTHHVCVLSASIDTSEHAYGFPNHRNSPLAKHPWNLKNLCQNPNSVLRSMGTIVGVTAPTLHVGMLFSTVCWYRDPHGLPWIEYLHTGASKIWYGVAANQEDKLSAALKKIVPDFVKDSAIWLPSDTAMVPPTELVREGVRVCRVVQDPGQFVVVFPGAFTSSVCKGYLISESAFFARPQYFDRAVASFKALHECCEPSMFSLDRLVLSVVSDPRATLDGLLRARELVLQVVEKEKKLRSQLVDIGLETSERLSTPDSHRKKKNRFIEDEEENMCEVCRQNLYVALVTNSQEEAVYCLEHALLFLSKNPSHLEFCKLMYTYSLSELDSAIKQMDERIHVKSGSKKSPYSKKTKPREHLDSFSSTSSSNL
ncbi:serine-rich adhesin for platelets [Palaemon carinicauda]|uniref:serine-rich adhesin for platelets n=1 Tax=Palaemon carinicauda TaxID=392227 RepID=UPI0035B66C61